jgi:MFS family permease
MLPYGLEWLDALEAFIPLDFFVLGLLPAAFIGIAMLILRDIAKGETPFSKKQSRRVRLIACLMFAWVVLGALLSAQVTTFYPDALVSLSYHISDSSTPTLYLDFGVLISAIVCYCISLAFEYGALLQRDSDDIV